MWSQGTIWAESKVGYDYWVKHYEEGSEFGIDKGRISKLEIRRHGENKTLASYERDWDIEVPDSDEIQAVYEIVLAKYN